MEKGVWRFEIALGLFFYIFFGGNPWKRESGDLRLLWDYFFFGWQPLQKGIRRFEIASVIFYFFWVASLWKREFFFNKFMINIFLNIFSLEKENLMKTDEI